jgi:hypothetical protein
MVAEAAEVTKQIQEQVAVPAADLVVMQVVAPEALVPQHKALQVVICQTPDQTTVAVAVAEQVVLEQMALDQPVAMVALELHHQFQVLL